MEAEVTKVYRIKKFKQDHTIRDYIDPNTVMRAKTEPDRDNIKLINIAQFGKTVENPLKHIKAKILTDEHGVLKSVSRTTFKDIFRYRGTTLKDFYNIEIKYDKPKYLVATVLELSKLFMYCTFLNVFKRSIKDQQLHYRDTDSFIISYSEGKVPEEYVDLSSLDIPVATNNKVPVKIKYKFGSRIIDNYINLLSKT